MIKKSIKKNIGDNTNTSDSDSDNNIKKSKKSIFNIIYLNVTLYVNKI
jgi:hypothetical protein